jgi:hypothetical protein
MKSRALLYVSAFALVLGGASQRSAAQMFNAKQNTDTRYHQIVWESPPACDAKTSQGFAAWTAAAARITFPQHSEFWYGAQQYAALHTQIFFKPAVDMETSGTAEVTWGRSVGTYYIDGYAIPIVDDADVTVNNDRWASNMLNCSSSATQSNQFDFAAIIAHEAGHVLGIKDTYNYPNCVMYGNAQYGKELGSLCQMEADGAVRLYGAR